MGMSHEPKQCANRMCIEQLPIPHAAGAKFCSPECKASFGGPGGRAKEREQAAAVFEPRRCQRQACMRKFTPVNERHVYCSSECGKSPSAPPARPKVATFNPGITRPTWCVRDGCYDRAVPEHGRYCSAEHAAGKPKPARPALAAVPAPAGKNHDADELGRRGRLRGGPTRVARMTQGQRAALARAAAEARWAEPAASNEAAKQEVAEEPQELPPAEFELRDPETSVPPPDGNSGAEAAQLREAVDDQVAATDQAVRRYVESRKPLIKTAADVGVFAPPTGDDPRPDEHLITHAFPLRRGLIVRIELPDDITGAEAARLCAWLRTLPIDAREGA